MTTGLYYHPSSNDHITPKGHSERVERLHAVLDALDGSEFSELARQEAPEATKEAIVWAHSAAYYDRICEAASDAGSSIAPLDADTSITGGSWNAAVRGAGAVTAAVDAVMDSRIDNAFCAVRPPGHHAEKETAMGFCLFNNVAVGVQHALLCHGLSKVAIIDFDVHHGNGTQAIFEATPSVFFSSSHQMPLYPGTGYEAETGVGNIHNLPLPPNAGSDAFRQVWQQKGLIELERFDPDMIFISAGFDGHRSDPLANMNLEEDDFAWITAEICRIATKNCGGRIVSTLEGGYDLSALGASVKAHVLALMGYANENSRKSEIA